MTAMGNGMMAIDILNNACVYVAGKASIMEVLPELERARPESSEILTLSDCRSEIDENHPDVEGPGAILAFDQRDRGVILSFADRNRAAIASGKRVNVGKDASGRIFLEIDQRPR